MALGAHHAKLRDMDAGESLGGAVARTRPAWLGRWRLGRVMRGPCSHSDMAYEWTAICDACGTRRTFPIETFHDKFPYRPLPAGWTHVHQGGRPGVITPEIGVACSRACLAKARRILLDRPVRERAPRPV